MYIVLEVLANVVKQEKETKSTQMRKNELKLFIEDTITIIYIENTKVFIKISCY